MSTENVTVLFTDLVNSTGITTGMPPDAADELRRSHFSCLRNVIADSPGSEVKNLGDGIMVVFPTASSALSCAIAMQQAVDRDNRRSGRSLGMRIGASAGEVTRERNDYFGDPVVEASRLCATAEGGQILASQLTLETAGRRRPGKYEFLGELDLKGLPDPVATVEVAWEPLQDGDDGPFPVVDLPAATTQTIPLPSRLRPTPGALFVGREADLQHLQTLWKEASQGDRRVVFLGGEPGIGKTSLVRILANRIAGGDAFVLYGRCDEDLGIPYQPWIEALRHLVRHGPDTLLNDHQAGRVAELARLVPELAERTGVPASQGQVDDSQRYLLFGAVSDLIARCAEFAPTLLVLDDLHWADRPTIQLLRHVIGSETASKLLILGTYRESELSPAQPFTEALAVLHREEGVERIGLKGLDDEELLELLEAYAGHSLEEDGIEFRNLLLNDTGGNPFFAGEIVRHLAESGALVRDENGRWTTTFDLSEIGLPVSVREVIGHRVGRLGRSTVNWLTFAAVIGREFDITLLANVLHVDQEDLLPALEESVRAGILVESDVPGRFAFAHALFEKALYGDLSALRRARAHRAVAEAIEDELDGDTGARVSELAYHWIQATQPQDPQKAIQYAELAGDRALQQLAPDEAVRWYMQALQMLDRRSEDAVRRRAVLMIGLGTAQRQLGDPVHRETLLEAARLAEQVSDTPTLVRAALANNRGFHSNTGEGDFERIRVVRAALDRLGEVDVPERALLLAILCTETLFTTPSNVNERFKFAEQAVLCARRAGDPIVLADVLVRPHMAISTPETLEMRKSWVEEAARLVPNDHRLLRWHVYGVRATVALESVDLPVLQESMAIFCEEAEAIGQPLCKWVSLMYTSWYAMLRGDLASAERLADEAFTLGMETAQPDAMMLYGMQLIDIRFCQDRLIELMAIIDELSDRYSGPQAFRSLQCLTAGESGDFEKARSLLDQHLEEDFEVYSGAPWLTAQVAWAVTAARVEHVPAARFLYERLAPWHRQIPTVNITAGLGCVARTLGLLADLLEDFEAADEWFKEALELDLMMQSPMHQAWTRASWAAMLCHRDGPGDREKARTMAREALAAGRTGPFPRVKREATAVAESLDL
ncbi:MAG TPA: AAA family ATPase [Acidimicrobiales bacterium]|nr:AAA family ATPase [Acidimicrobiales bacterium]